MYLFQTFEDTFLGVLTKPDKATDFLVSVNLENNKWALPSALMTVLIVYSILGMTEIEIGANYLDLGLDELAKAFITVLSAVCSGMIYWVFLAWILALAASLFKSEQEKTKFSKYLFLTAWIFVPLIISAPAYLYTSAFGSRLEFLVAIPIWWSFYLALLIFKKTLRTSELAIVGILFILPPLFFFSLACWAILALIVALNALGA